MQSTTSLPAHPGIRFGLRVQLMVALGFLVILTLGVAGAALWGAALSQYEEGFAQVKRAIAAGSITTPQAANNALAPFKDNIRTLTDSALEVAQRKAVAMEQAESALDKSASDTTWQLLAIVALVLVVAVGW